MRVYVVKMSGVTTAEPLTLLSAFPPTANTTLLLLYPVPFVRELVIG